MTFTGHVTHDADEWAARARPVLAAAPVEHHTLATTFAGARAGAFAVEPPWLAWVQDEDGATVGVAIRTPPHPVIVSTLPEAAAPALVVALRAAGVAPPGVVGPLPAADAVARAWAADGGAAPTLIMGQTVNALERVAPQPDPPAGAARAAGEGDRALLVEWMADFHVHVGLPQGDPAAAVQRALGSGRLRLWDDAGPACMVGWSPPALDLVRITLVYTPPERRGHGYAQAAVADVAARLLAGGAAGLVIITDADYPTPNRVYARVGFSAVADAAMWSLD